MLNKLRPLYLYRGGTSAINFDFTKFTFSGNGKCIFTISSIYEDNKLLQFEFNRSVKYTMIITDEFTASLKDNKYRYNIVYVIGDNKYPQCADSDIIVRDMVNATRDNS